VLIHGSLNWLQLLLPPGYTVRRPPARSRRVRGPLYSPSDPINSLIGAMQVYPWVDGAISRVWHLLFDRALVGRRVTEDEMRSAGGGRQATRRFRQIRYDLRWPVDCKKNAQGVWEYWMILTPAQRNAAYQARGQNIKVWRRRR